MVKYVVSMTRYAHVSRDLLFWKHGEYVQNNVRTSLILVKRIISRNLEIHCRTLPW